ncbi:hypothetical protein E2C01_077022 [Portunus trituberculatus]|uniref:Uncharacterized protein n=1 Tax=Portunus trituberculatus TaxID=210409 RepID=A0A5B7IEQ6_PORTR|nr:hypothetical protein [Portunus trituberculatus]
MRRLTQKAPDGEVCSPGHDSHLILKSSPPCCQRPLHPLFPYDVIYWEPVISANTSCVPAKLHHPIHQGTHHSCCCFTSSHKCLV